MNQNQLTQSDYGECPVCHGTGWETYYATVYDTDFQKKFNMLADVQSAKVVIEHRTLPEYQKSTMRQILASSILIFTRET